MPPATLSKSQRDFIVNYARHGMLQGAAARAAGYAFPDQEAQRLLRNPDVVAAIEKERKATEKAADVSRKEVIEKLMESYDMAKVMGEPIGMVSALREVAKICGYYEPEVKKIEVSVAAVTSLAQLQDLSDDDLAKMIAEAEQMAVDAESRRIEDEPLALGAPETDEYSDESSEPSAA